MTERSRFWVTGGGGDDDAISRDNWWDINEARTGSLTKTTNRAGIHAGSGNGTDVALFVEETSPASAQVRVNIGRAEIHGIWYENDAFINITVPANSSGNDRIDYLILRKNWSAQTVRLFVLQGTPSGSPVPPTLTKTNGVTWEFPIAQIAADDGFTTILDADITVDRTNGIAEFLFNITPEEGGTGKTVYADGDFLYAASVTPSALSVINILPKAHYASSDGTIIKSFDSRWSIVWYEEINGTVGESYSAGVYTKMTLDNEDDPSAYITLASSQIAFDVGTYELVASSTRFYTTTNQSDAGFRFRDVTNSVNIFERQFKTANVIQPPYEMFVPSTFIIASGSDQHELQVLPNNANATAGAAHIGGANDPNFVELYHWLAFRRVG